MSSSHDPSPQVAEFIAHWESLRPGPGLLPGRQHFDPLQVPRLLPNIWLVDVEAGPPRRHRIRLVGGALVEAGFIGQPGDTMDDPRLSPDPAKVQALFDSIAELGVPNWRRGPAIIDHARFVDSIERAMMPMARDGRTVDMVMSLTLFHWQDGRST